MRDFKAKDSRASSEADGDEVDEGDEGDEGEVGHGDRSSGLDA